MPGTNYHAHTTRCHHAIGTEEEYVQAAIREGFDTLGFSDHGPFPYRDGYVSGVRMTWEEMPGYLSVIRQLKEQYSGRIALHCGMEYEYCPEFLQDQRELLEEKKIDYMILGNHYDLDERTGMYFGRCLTPGHIARYVKTSIEGMETGLFSYFAHPDLYLNSYPVFDKAAEDAALKLCACAKALGLPLEYNLLGLKKQASGVPGLGYPYAAFWQIAAETGCAAILGIDAHAPSMFSREEYDRAAAALDTLGLRRVDTLRLSES